LAERKPFGTLLKKPFKAGVPSYFFRKRRDFEGVCMPYTRGYTILTIDGEMGRVEM
jgi:hypothetical protein